ncbi:urease accessory protein UreD [Oharaeibacter diazotrophicus]|uniref:Urease accessory protein UreD n=2 Tax=Oharaeibacter diazotrophicus TaxID=1920512 RepID=A0A4R6R6E4_9HYPH|nr:urease accessory protein UreD [Oharaeibacter diazotrophicus]TDP81126.1 urease accessory protein [Oharaeibacter diazotrophicus]BBE74881.1 urease accessory protein UreD [Pleomorphomonas sp. SM30]GLS75615.1 urease accessory protein UreD [Oharaeibacter diazotrophicus]
MTADPALDLVFDRHPSAGTRLTRRRARYPFVLTRAFRLDEHHPDVLTAIVQSASGAILGEDVLAQAVTVGPGASAHVTTPAAMTANRTVGGAVARETVTLRVAAGGLLEWLPAPRILLPGSALDQEVAATVDPDGIAVLADGFSVHDPEAAGRPFRFYAARLTVRRPDGRVLFDERQRLDGPPNRFGGAAGLTAHGALTVLAPSGEGGHGALAAALEAAVAGLPVHAGAGALPRGAGVALRIAAADGGAMRTAVTAAWAAARTALTGASPSRRRF